MIQGGKGSAQIAEALFETEVFGQKSAKIHLSSPPDEDAKQFFDEIVSKAKGQFEHLSIRISASEASSIHALEGLGFKFVDGLLTLGRKLKIEESQTLPSESVKEFAGVGSDGAAKIAFSALDQGRFFCDPWVPEEAARTFNERWCKNNFEGRADLNLVALDGLEIVGFCSCLRADEVAIIDLIAIDPSHQGKGLGKKLVGESIRQYAGKCRSIRVGTQANNLAALNLYTRMGFQFEDASYTFHLRLD